jgi:hypothetical protein
MGHAPSNVFALKAAKVEPNGRLFVSISSRKVDGSEPEHLVASIFGFYQWR